MSKTKIVYLSAIFFISLLFSLFFPLMQVLEISDTKGNEKAVIRRIKGDSNFSLSFMHSAQRSIVKDNFVIDGHNIMLVSTTFSDHGAGLPFDGDFEVLDNGKFRVSNINRTLSKINLTIGKESVNTFEIGDEQINLSQIYGDTTLVVHIRKYSPIIFLWRSLNGR